MFSIGTPSFNPWNQYAAYVDIHPTAIIASPATIRIFNPPREPRVCLRIGAQSHIFGSFNILRPEACIEIGQRTQIGAVNFVCANHIVVGDDVLMAWGSTVIDSDTHSLDWEHRRHDVLRSRRAFLKTQGADIARLHDWEHVKQAPIVIGNKSWIGLNVICLKGVTIGEGAIVGAGSVVTKDVKPWHVGAGNPFRHIRKLDDNEDGEK